MLVSVMLANNEVGTVEPVAEIAKAVRERAKVAEAAHRGPHGRGAGRERARPAA